jgi:trimethylamine:corrinoid methyltransferase-like protein
MSTVRSAEVIYEMAQAIGKPFAVGMYLISPFTCPPEGLEIIAAFLDRQVPLWVGTMPVAGLTAPIFMLGAHVQALAELMAGLALLHALAGQDVPIYWTPIDSVRAHPFDMRHATFVYSSPEDLLGTLLQAQLNERYGVPLVAKSLLTTAREPDEQAAAEKCAHTLLAGLAGARIFTNAGFLAVDEYISPAQVVIDHEIVQYVRQILAGLPVEDKTLALAAIRQVGPGRGNFLEHDTTLHHFREAAWDPALFSHIGLKASTRRDTPPLWTRARQMARQHIAAADYVLPESDRHLLERIYRKAEGGIAASHG